MTTLNKNYQKHPKDPMDFIVPLLISLAGLWLVIMGCLNLKEGINVESTTNLFLGFTIMVMSFEINKNMNK